MSEVSVNQKCMHCGFVFESESQADYNNWCCETCHGEHQKDPAYIAARLRSSPGQE
jgi:hypothetical protein